ncbi:MAG: hypothetical protein FWG41_05385 [Methanomassiliicoccaceae archaeon]|nr:hypothetical protein [Methanomassiliicoccaceae archaeon]
MQRMVFERLEGGKDELAAVMMITESVLEHIGFLEHPSPKSKRVLSDRSKTGLLVIKEFLDVSYRMLCRLLNSMSGVLAAGRIAKTPEHSTLRKFAGRLNSQY